MKKALSLLLLLAMMAMMVVPALAVVSSPSYIQPVVVVPTLPDTVSRDIDQQVPEGASGLAGDGGEANQLTITDENGNPAGTIPAKVVELAEASEYSWLRILYGELKSDGLEELIPEAADAQVLAMFDLEVPNANDESVFAEDGKAFAFALNLDIPTTAINPRAWFWNSNTAKFDEAKSLKRVAGNKWAIETTHVCPVIITVDGYESYYSRFVGKKVTSPDTIETNSLTGVMTVVAVVALLGSAYGMVAYNKKHI
jgi:hypothetical protein